MPHILIVQSPYYQEITQKLLAGATEYLKEKATYDIVSVSGALEIPPAISMAMVQEKYDGYIALGCVIRGETSHYEIVSTLSAQGIMDLSINQKLAIGNGILTVENEAQALQRADPTKGNKGQGAAEACLGLISLKESL